MIKHDWFYLETKQIFNMHSGELTVSPVFEGSPPIQKTRRDAPCQGILARGRSPGQFTYAVFTLISEVPVPIYIYI